MWKVEFIPEAIKDISKLDNSILMQVQLGIRKVSRNPLPKGEGGYGNPLSNKKGNDLTGYFKIKYKKIGYRVVYKLYRKKKKMIIVVVSKRSGGKCYELAEKRKLR